MRRCQTSTSSLSSHLSMLPSPMSCDSWAANSTVLSPRSVQTVDDADTDTDCAPSPASSCRDHCLPFTDYSSQFSSAAAMNLAEACRLIDKLPLSEDRQLLMEVHGKLYLTIFSAALYYLWVAWWYAVQIDLLACLRFCLRTTLCSQQTALLMAASVNEWLSRQQQQIHTFDADRWKIGQGWVMCVSKICYRSVIGLSCIMTSVCPASSGEQAITGVGRQAVPTYLSCTST